MIKSIEYIDGFPLKLPLIGNRKFEFKDGINYIFGSNGTGKSVILNTLKAYTGIATGGWTTFNNPQTLGCGRLNGPTDFPHAYATYSPANSKAVVLWDGTPTLFNNGDLKTPEVLLFLNFQQFGDGISSEDDLEKQLKEHPSAGQYRAQKINKIINLLKDGAPKYTVKDIPRYKDDIDNYYAKREWDYWQFINKLYVDTFGQGKTTVLLDEPERSLSHAKQKDLFLNVIPNQMKDLQVIIATHSLYSIFTPNANIIEMEAGYINGLKAAITDISKLANFNNRQMELGI
jgi:predicted ATPase